jgi:hypothetical protein
LAVQQDGSYLGCTGNRLTYGPARRRIGSDNVSYRYKPEAAFLLCFAMQRRPQIVVSDNLRCFRPNFP